MNASQLFEVVVSLPLQVLLVVIAIVALDRMIGNAAASCRLWTIGFFSIIGLVAAGFLVPHLRFVDLSSRLNDSTVRTVFTSQVLIVKVIGVVWVVGFFSILVRRLMRCVVLSRFLSQRCRSMTTDEIASLPLTDQDEPPTNVRWLVSRETHGPFCWQMQRPTIVLPSFMLREEECVLRHVLLHELEHLRTNHPLQHFLQGTCNALFWFHPAIWWAARNAELTREFHCDEVAAKAGNAIGSYLRTLAKVAEQNANAPTCTLAFGRRKSAIIRRTERLVSYAETECRHDLDRPIRRSMLSIGLLLFAVLLVSQIWLPVNVLASSRSCVSPWPTWTAKRLHDFGVSVRDYEQFDHRHDLNDILSGDDD